MIVIVIGIVIVIVTVTVTVIVIARPRHCESALSRPPQRAWAATRDLHRIRSAEQMNGAWGCVKGVEVCGISRAPSSGSGPRDRPKERSARRGQRPRLHERTVCFECRVYMFIISLYVIQCYSISTSVMSF